MLLRVEIENFLSFYKGSSFDLFPNLKRTSFPSHVYSEMVVPVLKQSVIYGANGSGKSNLLKAVEFIRHFALDKDRKSTRLNSSHVRISYAVFCLKKKKK